MSNKSRQMLQALLPDLQKVKGTVELPATFADASSFSNMNTGDVAIEKIRMIMDKKAPALSKAEMKSLNDKLIKVMMDFYMENYDLMSKMEVSGLSQHLKDSVTLVKHHQEVVPQYSGFKAKFAGMLFGFYINHSVRQQNELNRRYAVVSEEFQKLAEERIALNNQIMTAYAKLHELEKEAKKKGGKA